MLAVPIWLRLKQETRAEIAKMFNLRKSGGVIVNGNQVASDGYSPFDLMGIDIKGLKFVLGVEECDDFYKLFDELVFRVENPDEIRIKPEAIFVRSEVKEEPVSAPVETKKKEKNPIIHPCCKSKIQRHKMSCKNFDPKNPYGKQA